MNKKESSSNNESHVLKRKKKESILKKCKHCANTRTHIDFVKYEKNDNGQIRRKKIKQKKKRQKNHSDKKWRKKRKNTLKCIGAEGKNVNTLGFTMKMKRERERKKSIPTKNESVRRMQWHFVAFSTFTKVHASQVERNSNCICKLMFVRLCQRREEMCLRWWWYESNGPKRRKKNEQKQGEKSIWKIAQKIEIDVCATPSIHLQQSKKPDAWH